MRGESYAYNNPLKYTDPSGHCPDCWEFASGLLSQVLFNANPIPAGYGYIGAADALAVQPYESDAKLAGRMVGTVGSAVLSFAEIASGISIGTGGGIGGLLACVPTAGGGCVVAAGSVALGAGLATEGVATGANTIASGVKTLSVWAAKGRGGNRELGDLFRRAGLKTPDYFLGRLSQRIAEERLTEEDAFKAWKSGRSYFDEANNSYIRYDPKTGVYVVVKEDGTLVTVTEGGVSPDWTPSDWTPPDPTKQ